MAQEVFLSLGDGFLRTLELFALTLLGALPLGLVICFGSMSSFPPLRWVTRTVVWVIRGTPLMLQLLVIFFGPGLLGNPIWGGSAQGRMAAAAVAFIINYACYFSEIYRGGIESIPKGQYEAGQVLGLTKGQIFFKIVLKQVVKRIIPPMGNEIITLVKDTALARIISVYEVVWAGQAFIKSDGILWPLFLTGAFYLIFSGLLTVALNKAERALDYIRT